MVSGLLVSVFLAEKRTDINNACADGGSLQPGRTVACLGRRGSKSACQRCRITGRHDRPRGQSGRAGQPDLQSPGNDPGDGRRRSAGGASTTGGQGYPSCGAGPAGAVVGCENGLSATFAHRPHGVDSRACVQPGGNSTDLGRRRSADPGLGYRERPSSSHAGGALEVDSCAGPRFGWPSPRSLSKYPMHNGERS